MNVVVSNLQDTIPMADELLSLVQKAAESALTAEGAGTRVELGVALVDDDYIHDLNLRFRGRDQPTDVLAFPMREEEPAQAGEEGGVFLLGDVVISLPAAVRQAAEYGHGVNRELVRLVVHGTLHLLGYDHEQREDSARMRKREEAVLGLEV